ncbi:XRE family transcriptional regulator [Aestuariivirga sp.]|uniref:XRE family transcriptional regulator n=1 Tax=Aestuariivirga sp. TaxID=2650926 RepID=UPI0039E64D0B
MKKAPTDLDKLIGERIKRLRNDVLDMNQTEFAVAVGVSRGAVGNWELGQGVGREALQRIAMAFRVSLDWLANGTGEAPVPGDVVPGRFYVPESANNNTSDGGEDSAFFVEKYQAKVPGARPEVDGALGAGEGQVGEMVLFPIGDSAYSGHRVTAEWLIPDQFITSEARATKSRTIIMPVVGDSMFPSYNYGDRVLVDLAQNEFLQDAVYAISDGTSAPQIKRLHHVFRSTPKRVRIISDNAAYEPEEHFLSDIHIIGRVCGVIARR